MIKTLLEPPTSDRKSVEGVYGRYRRQAQATGAETVAARVLCASWPVI